jgi:VCBS repeat protein
VAATCGLLAAAPCTANATVAFKRDDLPAGGSPLSVAVGDVDSSRGPDVVVALYDVGKLSVRLNHGDGTFAAPVLVPAACGPVQVELSDVTSNGSDFARDGRLDAVVACLSGGRVVRMAGDGAGGFAAPTQPGPPSNGAALASSDFFALARMRDNDGPPLLLVRAPAPSNQHVLCASYDWAILDPCLTPPGFPAIGGPLVAADANGGGLDEVVTLGGAKGVAIFGISDVPNKIFAWSDRDFGTASSGARALAIGDLEADGHPDVVTGWGNSFGAAVNVVHGYATGLPDLPAESFVSVAGLSELTIGDFDGDGRNDVLAATGYGRAVVHSGDGAGNLGLPQDVPLYGYRNPATATVVRLAAADLDGNGSRDAVVIDQSNQLVQILRNTTTAYVPPPGGGSPVVPPGPAPRPKLAPLAGLTGLPDVTAVGAKSIVRLGGASNPPTASVSLKLTAPRAKTAVKAKTVTLGQAIVTIQPGTTRALRVKLNKKGRARFRRSHRLKVSLRIVATAPDGTTAYRTRSLTIKRRPHTAR